MVSGLSSVITSEGMMKLIASDETGEVKAALIG